MKLTEVVPSKVLAELSARLSSLGFMLQSVETAAGGTKIVVSGSVDIRVPVLVSEEVSGEAGVGDRIVVEVRDTLQRLAHVRGA